MVKEVKWTKESIKTFEQVIDYLEKHWTEKEVLQFIQATDRVVRYISVYPSLFRKIERNIHEAFVTPHNLLIYKVYSSHIDLISFWNTRRNPMMKKIK
jgi:glucose-6-phosphate 1-dehydrogenase